MSSCGRDFVIKTMAFGRKLLIKYMRGGLKVMAVYHAMKVIPMKLIYDKDHIKHASLKKT